MIYPWTALTPAASEAVERQREKLARLLLDLGDRPSLVATTLLAQGCRGRASSSEQCPVAVYLQRQTGEKARTYSIFASLHSEETGFEVLTPLPPAVEAFVQGFDTGRYPALEAPG